MIFVFGSNLGGIHGAGAALVAWKQGYPMGLGSGFDAGSGCYGIPTKDERIQSMHIDRIALYVDQFIEYAELGHEQFKVTRIGCGLAGFDDEDIAPLFSSAPPNCYFDLKWAPYLHAGMRFWGTF